MFFGVDLVEGDTSLIQKHVKMLRTGLGMRKDDILIPFSAETKQGREEIWALIESRMAQSETVEENDIVIDENTEE